MYGSDVQPAARDNFQTHLTYAPLSFTHQNEDKTVKISTHS